MKKILKKIGWVFLTILLLGFLIPRSLKMPVFVPYAKSSEWKYGDGHHIGDWLEFSHNIYTIDKKGNIYVDGTLAAKLKRAGLGRMVVKSESEAEGYYVKK